jgi:hypothetical protein
MHHIVKRIAPLAALALGTALSGCYSGVDVGLGGDEGVPLAELDMSGAAPDELVLASGDDVIVRDGDALDIAVENDPDDKLRFVLEDDALAIRRKGNNWSSGNRATVRITMPPPATLAVAGSGSIRAQSLAREAELNIGGSGEIAVETIAADTLEINVGGSGSVTGAGTARELEISIGGSGDVDFARLKAETAEIAIGGSGDVVLASDGEVQADIAGSGDIRVKGSATCSVNTFGSGTLSCSPANEDGDKAQSASAEAALETANPVSES